VLGDEVCDILEIYHCSYVFTFRNSFVEFNQRDSHEECFIRFVLHFLEHVVNKIYQIYAFLLHHLMEDQLQSREILTDEVNDKFQIERHKHWLFVFILEFHNLIDDCINILIQMISVEELTHFCKINPLKNTFIFSNNYHFNAILVLIAFQIVVLLF